MIKRVLGLLGILLFCSGIGLFIFLNRSASVAQSLDRFQDGHGLIAGEFIPCNWTVSLPQRVVSEHSSQSLIITTQNSSSEPCESTLSLLAPGFDISPRKDDQVLSAQPNSPGSTAWVVSPRQTGTYELAITDGVDTQTVGLKVNNTLGLSPSHLQIMAILTPIFGPMLTFPWWIDKWLQRRKSKNQTTTSTPQL